MAKTQLIWRLDAKLQGRSHAQSQVEVEPLGWNQVGISERLLHSRVARDLKPLELWYC